MWVQIKFNDGSYTQAKVSGLEEIEEKYGWQNIKLIARMETYEI